MRSNTRGKREREIMSLFVLMMANREFCLQQDNFQEGSLKICSVYIPPNHFDPFSLYFLSSFDRPACFSFVQTHSTIFSVSLERPLLLEVNRSHTILGEFADSKNECLYKVDEICQKLLVALIAKDKSRMLEEKEKLKCEWI